MLGSRTARHWCMRTLKTAAYDEMVRRKVLGGHGRVVSQVGPGAEGPYHSQQGAETPCVRESGSTIRNSIHQELTVFAGRQ